MHRTTDGLQKKTTQFFFVRKQIHPNRCEYSVSILGQKMECFQTTLYSRNVDLETFSKHSLKIFFPGNASLF